MLPMDNTEEPVSAEVGINVCGDHNKTGLPLDELNVDYLRNETVVEREADAEGQELCSTVLPGPYLERKPRNKWTIEQKEYLCVLARWYEPNWITCTRIFNHRFADKLAACGYEQPMSLDTVKLYYYDMCPPTLQTVFENTNFMDEKQCYISVRAELESIAKLLGTPLEARCAEDDTILKVAQAYWAGKQARMKKARRSPRKVKRSLRRLRQIYRPRDDSEDSNDDVEHSDEASQLGESEPDTADCPRSSPKGNLGKRLKLSRTVPRLTFRCYDRRNQGHNSPSLFRAGAFDIVPPSNLSVEKALELEDDDLLKHASNHIHGEKQPTPFISTTDSLLWAIHRARVATLDFAETDVHIAVIDADAAAQATRMYHGRHIISLLKRKGMVDWKKKRRYNGNFEWLILGEIRQEAIIHDFTLADLRAFAVADARVGSFLRLKAIDPRKSCTEVRMSMEPMPVNRELGRTVVNLATFMGLDAPRATPLIAPFITCLIQGWRVEENETDWYSNRDFIAEIMHHLPRFTIDLLPGGFNPPVHGSHSRATPLAAHVHDLITPPPTPNPTRSRENPISPESSPLLCPSLTASYHLDAGTGLSMPQTPTETPARQADFLLNNPLTPTGAEHEFTATRRTSAGTNHDGPLTPPATPRRRRQSPCFDSIPLDSEDELAQVSPQAPYWVRTSVIRGVTRKCTPRGSGHKLQATDVHEAPSASVAPNGPLLCKEAEQTCYKRLDPPEVLVPDSSTTSDDSDTLSGPILAFRRDISRYFMGAHESEELHEDSAQDTSGARRITSRFFPDHSSTETRGSVEAPGLSEATAINLDNAVYPPPTTPLRDHQASQSEPRGSVEAPVSSEATAINVDNAAYSPPTTPLRDQQASQSEPHNAIPPSSPTPTPTLLRTCDQLTRPSTQGRETPSLTIAGSPKQIIDFAVTKPSIPSLKRKRSQLFDDSHSDNTDMCDGDKEQLLEQCLYKAASNTLMKGFTQLASGVYVEDDLVADGNANGNEGEEVGIDASTDQEAEDISLSSPESILAHKREIWLQFCGEERYIE